MIIIGGSKSFREQVVLAYQDYIGRLDNALAGIKDASRLSSKVAELTEQVNELEVSKSKKEEEFARREREIDHKVGLVKKSQELELEAQKLELREASLTQKEEAFKKEMKFMTDRMEKENVYVREMLESMMKRLPSAELIMNITQTKKAR